MVFELVSFDVATQHFHQSPSADCSHLKWKSPNGTLDNTVRIAMTIYHTDPEPAIRLVYVSHGPD